MILSRDWIFFEKDSWGGTSRRFQGKSSSDQPPPFVSIFLAMVHVCAAPPSIDVIHRRTRPDDGSPTQCWDGAASHFVIDAHGDISRRISPFTPVDKNARLAQPTVAEVDRIQNILLPRQRQDQKNHTSPDWPPVVPRPSPDSP